MREFPDGDLILAIDIGGSKFIVGLATPEGDVICSDRYEWVGATGEGLDEGLFFEQLCGGIDALRASEPEAFSRAVVAGVTVPGFTDPVSGDILDTDFLKIKGYPLCAELNKRYMLPFFADNDCKAAALAEQVFGAARGKSILYVTISTGVGGTHVLDDGVYYGAFGHAGEVGLVIADRHGYASDQGLPGVLEAHACGRGLVKNYLAAGGREYVDGRAVDGRIMADLSREGDGPAGAALELEGRLLARMLAPICSVVDVEAVVIGGGMSLQYDTYGPALEREFARLCPLEVGFAPTSLGYLGAFLGAVALALRGHAGALPEPADASRHVLEVLLGARSIDLHVTLNGRERLLRDGSVPALDGFLLAEDADDPGETLGDRFARVLAPYGAELDGAFARVSDEAVLDDLGYSLGRALAALATVLDPGRIVFSGTLGDAWEVLGPSVRRALVDETYYRGDLPFALGTAENLSNYLSL